MREIKQQDPTRFSASKHSAGCIDCVFVTAPAWATTKTYFSVEVIGNPQGAAQEGPKPEEGVGSGTKARGTPEKTLVIPRASQSRPEESSSEKDQNGTQREDAPTYITASGICTSTSRSDLHIFQAIALHWAEEPRWVNVSN